MSSRCRDSAVALLLAAASHACAPATARSAGTAPRRCPRTGRRAESLSTMQPAGAVAAGSRSARQHVREQCVPDQRRASGCTAGSTATAATPTAAAAWARRSMDDAVALRRPDRADLRDDRRWPSQRHALLPRQDPRRSRSGRSPPTCARCRGNVPKARRAEPADDQAAGRRRRCSRRSRSTAAAARTATQAAARIDRDAARRAARRPRDQAQAIGCDDLAADAVDLRADVRAGSHR